MLACALFIWPLMLLMSPRQMAERRQMKDFKDWGKQRKRKISDVGCICGNVGKRVATRRHRA